MPSTLLITGASGTVGRATIEALRPHPEVRLTVASRRLSSNPDVPEVLFDFERPETHLPALQGVDVLFLLRPPQISDAKGVFGPLLQAAREAGVSHVVFLSVQGAESSSFIPHHKIERLIVESGIPYTFLRPAYFMQNFLGNLHQDLVRHQEIFLPAGKAPFSLIDVRDLGEVAAEVLLHPEAYQNQGIDLTTQRHYTFAEMAEILSGELGRKITYRSPNLLRFFLRKKREGLPTGLILVMIMLHFLPRISSQPALVDTVEKITGHPPREFEAFVRDMRPALLPD